MQQDFRPDVSALDRQILVFFRLVGRDLFLLSLSGWTQPWQNFECHYRQCTEGAVVPKMGSLALYKRLGYKFYPSTILGQGRDGLMTSEEPTLVTPCFWV